VLGEVLVATVLGYSGVLASLGVWRMLLRRGVLNRRTWHVLVTATSEASQRGHRLLGAEHVALTLLYDSEIADELEARGVDLKSLYDDLERGLGPRVEVPTALKEGDITSGLLRLLRMSAPLLPPRPPQILAVILSDGPAEIRATYAKHGVTAETWRAHAPARPDDPPPSDALESGPYRTIENANAKFDVLFWNDKKTPMIFVVDLLRGTFGILEPYATRLTLTVDREGVAVVAAYDHADAERLARMAIDLARARGYPLKVTVAPSRVSSLPNAGSRRSRSRSSVG
jgi:ATP-dependent Clp protease adapter protein ClpS